MLGTADFRLTLGEATTSADEDTSEYFDTSDNDIGRDQSWTKEKWQLLSSELDADSDPEDIVEEMRAKLKPGQKLGMDWKGDPMIINPGDNLPGVTLM